MLARMLSHVLLILLMSLLLLLHHLLLSLEHCLWSIVSAPVSCSVIYHSQLSVAACNMRVLPAGSLQPVPCISIGCDGWTGKGCEVLHTC